MVRQAVNDEVDTPAAVVEPTQGYLICSLYGGLYGLDVTRVRHIGTIGRVWRLPLVPDYVKGVTRIRDRLIPLVDLRLKLGRPAAAYHPRTCAVEVNVSIPIAVAVDSVEGVRYFADREVVPAARFAMGIGSHAVTGIVCSENRSCLILDLDWILLGRSSRARNEEVAGAVPPSVGSSRQREASNDGVTACSEYADIPRSKDLEALGLLNRDPTASVPFPAGHTVHPLLRFDTRRSLESSCGHGPAKTSDRAREERLISLLAKSAFAGRRRIPGFRPGGPRLSALAVALLEMPTTFHTKEAAPVVATLLGRSSEDYRTAHFRYDLRKLRARHLAERIGATRRYRLTRIGRVVCEALETGAVAADLLRARVTTPLQNQPAALSA